uniref:Kinesin-like protein n=2 Tax=Lygus hesperus TaxID=30085 RepID=A0A0A9Y1C5_LYGHE
MSSSNERAKSARNECVQVVVRCRPMNEKELMHGHENVVSVYPSRGVVEIFSPKDDDRSSAKMFTYDAVYDSGASQRDLYEESVFPLVSSVLEGFNGTIFAYGQTGTGKTYTMEGRGSANSENRGIIPRSFDQIFTHISRSDNMQYLVRASYLEIYQEEIRDLLDTNPKKRYELRESVDSGVYVKDLQSFVCKSVGEIEKLMATGNQNRTIGATNMNEHSSRSHAIFMVTIEMSDTSNQEIKNQVRVGKLNLVDLAGSERQTKTGSTGTRLKEASKINLSLSALGNVISALVDGKGQHIPYRDSKLTRLLQDSLGGNSKTIMIANIGPASYNYEESLTTLRYANRAKNIKNKPRINEDPKDALLRQYQEEISRLRAMLENTNDSSTINKKKKRKKDDDGEEKTHEEMLNEEEANLIKREKKVMNDDMPETERKRLLQEIEARKQAILEEKKAHEELTNRIQAMESKLLRGGKNIIDHTNEQQKALEQRTIEINERKRKELQMRQMLEIKEDSMEGIRETYASLQQEIEAKNNKVKKLYQKLQSIRQEVQDTTENFNADRRELEDHHNALLKDYKLQLLIIDNFIPPEERKRISSRLFYDDEEDAWKMMPESEPTKVLGRMKSNPGERRPLTEYAKTAREIGLNYRYKGENILELDLEYPSRSTKDYQGPAVAPSVLSALEAALKGEEDIDVDASPSINRPKRGVKSAYARTSTKPTYPKTRGLVPK